MRSALLQWTIAFGGLLLICAVVFSQTTTSPQRSFSEIANAAFESDRNYQAYLMTVGKLFPIPPNLGFERGEYEIPPDFWPVAIKELKPVKVYDHMLNIVIVLSIRDGREEGIYIHNVISSYAPIGTHTDGFQFMYKSEEPKFIYFKRTIRGIGKPD